MTLQIRIAGREPLDLHTAVFDLNGTLTRRGAVIPRVPARLQRLRDTVDVLILSSDTYGSLATTAQELGVPSTVVGSGAEKATIVEQIGPAGCVAIGNGRNDVLMMRAAALGIAIIGREGCASEVLSTADIAVTSILDALDLLLDPTQIAATLRA